MCGKSFTRCMQDLQAWQSAKEELQLADHVHRVQAHRSARTLPSRFTLKWRRGRLLCGNLIFGEKMSCDRTTQCAWAGKNVEISADGMTSPYLRNFMPSKHKVIFWDECPVYLVSAYRKLFQCPASWITLGVSPTDRDVYSVAERGSSCHCFQSMGGEFRKMA